MQADFLPAEPQGKPKNTGVGSLSLLQQNLPDPGIEPGSPTLEVDSLPTELPGKLLFFFFFLQFYNVATQKNINICVAHTILVLDSIGLVLRRANYLFRSSTGLNLL